MLCFTYTDQDPNSNLPCLLAVSEVPRSVSSIAFGVHWNILALIRQSRSDSYSRDLLFFFSFFSQYGLGLVIRALGSICSTVVYA